MFLPLSGPLAGDVRAADQQRPALDPSWDWPSCQLVGVVSAKQHPASILNRFLEGHSMKETIFASTMAHIEPADAMKQPHKVMNDLLNGY